jgi:hypothetical protein
LLLIYSILSFQNQRRKRRRRAWRAIVEEVHPEPGHVATTHREKRRKGEHGRNKMPDGQYTIDDVNGKGEPTGPKESISKFRTACGYLVREHVPLTTLSWPEVSDSLKDRLWADLSRCIIFPQDRLDIAKKNALSVMGKCWRNWKSEMNTKYVQKGLTPFKTFGRISQAEWDLFVAQKKP